MLYGAGLARQLSGTTQRKMSSLFLVCFLAYGVVLGTVCGQNAPDCQAQADILFIMDSTGSIYIDDYKMMLKFVANLTHTFTLGPRAIQFGAIVFSNVTQTLFNLGAYTDHSRLDQALLAAPYLGMTTNTDVALRTARLQSFTAPYGARSGVTRIAIVLTDGKSSTPINTAQEARFLKESGVLVLSIGIGSSVDQTELQTIASSSLDVFQVNSFDVLDTIAKQVTNKTCEEVVTPPKQVAACEAQADILFLLDSSFTISRLNYNKMISFVVNVTRHFNIGPNAIQFATVVFSNTASLQFNFNLYTDHPALEAALQRTPYLGQTSYTDQALKVAREQAFTVAHGSRPSVPKIAVVVTDGQSSNPSSTATQARLLKDTGVRVFSIGIGTSANPELQTLASTPRDVFTATNFNSLDNIQFRVTNRTCEEILPPEDVKVTCNVTRQADILFILDSSGSIGDANYSVMLNFVVDITRNFNFGPNGIQFASVIFGTDVQEVFDFTTYTTQSNLERGILNTPYMKGWTYTDKALRLAREQMFTPAKGSRPGVQKIAIVCTDGQSNNKTGTQDQSAQLKQSGVLVLSIGIGNGVNKSELQTIASASDDVFEVSDFSVLSTIQKEVTNKTCQQVTSAVTTPQAACEAQADILFIMDSSGSILSNNYQKMLHFVVNLTRNFNVGPKAVQFGNVIFSDRAAEVFDFTKYANHSSLEKGILSTPYLMGGTATADALQLARETMFTESKGSRPDVPKIAIVLTDGLSYKPADTATEAKLLKNSGVFMISIGIGDSVNPQELDTIASLPEDVFQVTDFSVLDTIQQQVANKTCERVTEEKPDCPAVADILFIMDSTGSIGEGNYKTMLTFVANFTRSFALGTKWVQFSVITFGDSAHNEFSFSEYTTHSALEKAILNSTYFDETTQTDLALKMARELSFTSQNGARPDVDKIAIVLTDGRSNDPGLTAQEAKSLKDSGVLVITVAIGKDIMNSELQAIATLPEDVFRVDHFDALEAIEKEFTKQTCDRVTQTIECEAQADILFILDSSSSIDSVNYAKMLHFVLNLTRYFDLGPKAVQFSVIIFGDDAHLEVDFGQYSNHLSLEQGILGIRYLSQNTFTNRALMLARLQAFTAAHGARGNVSKIAIVFTDGQSALPTETTREAQLLKDTGVLVLSVGIGNTVKRSELETIASLPTDVFEVNNFDVLQSVQTSLANRTCEKVTSPQTSACTKHVDIIFLLDSSGSVSSDDYRTELVFAANFTNNFQIGMDSALFGAVIFSDTATKLFDLSDHSEHDSILRSLLAAPHLKGGTNTAAALQMIFSEGLFNVAGGGRLNATKMLFIMTDGQSANINNSIAAAQQLKNTGVQILTIGVGDVGNVAELRGMASTAADFFQADSYEVLHQLQEQVTNHTCGFIKPPPPAHRACSEKADIIFVFDSSSSITAEDYKNQLLFASNVTQEFDVGPVDALFAAVAFSSDVYKVFDLGQFSDHLNLFNGLLNSPHLTGSTDTAQALDWITEMEMFQPANGGRDNASKIVILFIDNPSIDSAEAVNAAGRLKRQGVHITTVGVNNYDLYEIRQIASSPLSAFKATSPEALHWIERDLVDDVCDFASTGY